MRRGLIHAMGLLGIVGISVAGLLKLRFETDILEVLPRGVAAVEALKVSQEHFDNDRQLILLLESNTGEVDEGDAGELAAHLRQKLAPAEVRHVSEFEENPAVFAAALADLWRNAPPEAVGELTARLSNEDRLKAHLSEVKAKVASSFDPVVATMMAYDPLGFLNHPALVGFLESDFSFRADDGSVHLLLIRGAEDSGGYREDAEWLEKIRKSASEWSGLEEYGLTFQLTGGPVFNAEIGAGMEHDMSGTVVLTSILIAALFLLIQRQLAQLLVVSLMLGLTFVVTLGLAGWVYGTLNLVSVGFAAILLGLVIDYAVVILRESAESGLKARELRRELAPGILWAAATTAIVFGLLMFSTFTGVRQLGGLIVMGLTVGAGLMLAFTPVFLERFPVRSPESLRVAPFLKNLGARCVMVLCLLGSGAVFVSKGWPEVSFDFSMVEPRSSEAAVAFAKIQEKFPAWSDRNLQMIATADSWEDLTDVADEAGRALASLKKAGVVESYQWPRDFIPNSEQAEANRGPLLGLSGQREGILAVVKSSGFSESGAALGEQVLAALGKEAGDGSVSELGEPFISRSADGKYHLAGTVRTKSVMDGERIASLSPLFAESYTVTGWPVLQSVLLPSVKRDFKVLFLPAGVLLLLALVFVFRSFRDAALAIAVMVTALLMVNAFTVLSGKPWNFLSGMAIPLIIGTGIDYSIHLVFSLRRNGGDFSKVWNGAGKAICFCGLSTSIGFGSLLMASNETLRSMGLMCSVGVLLTTTLSLLVLPGLWQRASR